jgi:transmembrane sensor
MDPLHQHLADELLEKYLQGNCSPEEIRFIEKWYDGLSLSDRDKLAEDPAFARYVENRLRSRLAGLTPLKSSVTQRETYTGPRIQKQSPYLLKRFVPLLAASLTGVILLVTAILYFSGHSVRNSPFGESIATGRAQLKKINLPDGSEVWLNQLSSLKWTSSFNDKDSTRQVQLIGEGRFKVVSDPSRPFIVLTSHNTYTKVLGTEFDVEAYSDEAEIRVSLLSGKVLFGEQSGNRGTVILQPGTMCSYSQAGHTGPAMPIGNLEVDGWIKGAIVFNEVPLREAIHRLALRYDWEVSWHKATPAGATVTSIFRHETREQILAAIAFANGFRFSLKNKKLTVY